MDLAEKLEAALVAYLKALDPSPYPAYFDPATQIKPGETDLDKDNQQLRAAAAAEAEAEFPIATGNFWWPCTVEVRTPAQLQTAAAVASEDPAEATSQLAKHRTLATILENHIMVSDLPAQLNAAALALGEGYELTVLGVNQFQPGSAQVNDVYSSGYSFRVYCCSRVFAPAS